MNTSVVHFVRSRIVLGSRLNNRGPRIANELARTLRTEVAEDEDVLGTMHSLPLLMWVDAIIGVWSRFGTWPSRIRQVYMME